MILVNYLKEPPIQQKGIIEARPEMPPEVLEMVTSSSKRYTEAGGDTLFRMCARLDALQVRPRTPCEHSIMSVAHIPYFCREKLRLIRRSRHGRQCCRINRRISSIEYVCV